LAFNLGTAPPLPGAIPAPETYTTFRIGKGTPLRHPSMKIHRRKLLFAILAGSIVAWLVCVAVERSCREKPNYSLIEQGLFMGGWVEKPPPGTKAVLNLCEIEDVFSADVMLHEPIRDSAPAPDIAWLRRMVEFVDREQTSGRPTYVHCFQGRSRSGLVVAAYLMSRERWDREQALAFVRSKRPQVCLNPAFMQLLVEWERAQTTD
jgi:hypothetical protein